MKKYRLKSNIKETITMLTLILSVLACVSILAIQIYMRGYYNGEKDGIGEGKEKGIEELTTECYVEFDKEGNKYITYNDMVYAYDYKGDYKGKGAMEY